MKLFGNEVLVFPGAEIVKKLFQSKCWFWLKEFFSNQLLGSEYEENMLRGIRIGYNFWKNCHIILDVHDVFYDINLDNDVDLLRTSIAQLKVNF